jgi:hypothetical protein
VIAASNVVLLDELICNSGYIGTRWEVCPLPGIDYNKEGKKKSADSELEVSSLTTG